MEVPQQTKHRTAINIWFSNYSPGYISKEKKKHLICKDTCASVFIVALLTAAKVWK